MSLSLQDIFELDTLACAIARKIQSRDLSQEATDHLIALIAVRLEVSGGTLSDLHYRIHSYFPPLEKEEIKTANFTPTKDTIDAQNLALEPKKGTFAPLKKQKKRKNP